MTIIAFIPMERVLSMNTVSWISTVPWGSERSEWVSPWMERVSEVLRSEWVEWAYERMNVASDRVARQKSDCLWLEKDPMSLGRLCRPTHNKGSCVVGLSSLELIDRRQIPELRSKFTDFGFFSSWLTWRRHDENYVCSHNQQDTKTSNTFLTCY